MTIAYLYASIYLNSGGDLPFLKMPEEGKMNKHLSHFTTTFIALAMICAVSATPANAYFFDDAFSAYNAAKNKVVETLAGPEWHVDSRPGHCTVHVQIPTCHDFDGIPVLPTEYVTTIMDPKCGKHQIGINIGERGKTPKATDGPSILLALPGVISAGPMGLRRSDKEEVMDVVIDRMIDTAELFCSELVELPTFVLTHQAGITAPLFNPEGTGGEQREVVADFAALEPEVVVNAVFAWTPPTPPPAPKRSIQKHVDPVVAPTATPAVAPAKKVAATPGHKHPIEKDAKGSPVPHKHPGDDVSHAHD